MVSSAPSDGCRQSVPALKSSTEGITTIHTSNEAKSTALFNVFFPNENTIPAPPEQTDYPRAKFDLKPITDDQIRRAIKKLQPFKAPGPNGVQNIVYKECTDTLLPYIGLLF